MRLWASAHAIDDFYQGLIPAAVPYFVLERHFSYLGASGLTLAATLGSALPQLGFGVLADRRRHAWMAPLGVSLAGIGAGLAGLATSYPLVFALLAISGLGVSLFHPSAGRDARLAAGGSATAMSYFAAGGSIGTFLALALVTPALDNLGIGATALFIPPAVLMGFVLCRRQRRLSAQPTAAQQHKGVDRWGLFAALTCVEVKRSSRVIVVTERAVEAAQVSTASGSGSALESGRADDASGAEPRVVRPRGWAKTVTDVLSPAHFVIVLPPIIGWHATSPRLSGLAWGLFCAGLAGGVPYGFVIHAVLRRKVSDIHIRKRQDRYIPILVALGAMGLCVGVLILGSAPRVLIALLVSLLSTIVVGGLITTRWQISGHAAAAAGSVGICALCFGAWVLVLTPVIVLICAARLVLRDHTLWQLAAGVGLGGVLSPLILLALR
jgi:MFS family permease